MVRFRRFSSVCLLAALPLLFAAPARAGGDDPSVTFFTQGPAEARWVQFSPPPPGDPDNWSIKLRLSPVQSCFQPNYVNCPYAGARLQGVAGSPPAIPPSYDLYSTVSGPSGGSPRLVMIFSDGGDMELRPLSWTADVWVHIDGSYVNNSGQGLWDVNGGICGFAYAATYSAGLACHMGQSVTDVYVVTDSAWQLTNPSGYTHYIDNISYGNALVTRPSQGCHEGDGDGEFQGDHGKGNAHFDGDGCADGDDNQVSSSDRGDGKSFQSTAIDSISVNSLDNTMTIAGVGTVDGAPVAFVLVSVETTPLTPGSISMTFSDGFTNTGDLTSGSVLLH